MADNTLQVQAVKKTAGKLAQGANVQLLDVICHALCAEALRYCRIRTIPDDMVYSLAELAVGRYRVRQYGSAELPQTVSSITDGDQTVSYSTSGSGAEGQSVMGGLSAAEMSTLNLWRCAF